MDAYHEVLVKLFEVSEGKVARAVDFRDLVKKVGFFGSYNGIFERLSQEGWIAQAPKENFVHITVWGIAEAKKAMSENSGEAKPTSANAGKCVEIAKEFIKLVENYSKDTTKDNLAKVETKFSELELSFNLAKNDAK